MKSDFIPEEEVRNYFCASDLITQTYRTTLHKVELLRLYHFERPMLVTNVGGLAEIVPHNKVGYVCDHKHHDITDCILEFYNKDKESEFSENTKKEKRDLHGRVSKRDRESD